MTKTSTLLEGLTFAEGPRWRSGNLWFSDFYAREVIRVDEAGLRQTVVEVPEQPSGLGWTKDQELLVVSMRDQRVLRLENDILIQHADLSEFSSYWCNDMVVDNKGGAYVGNFGFNRRAGEKACSTTLVRVSPEGKPSLAAEGLWFPNGMVITPDGNTLIVAETFGHRLTAFDVSRDGSLSNQRIFAEHRGMYPDGICLDVEGAIWVADPRNKEVIRVKEGGEILERVLLGDRGAYACTLGGADGCTLFICTNTDSGPENAADRAGKIEFTQVAVPGAGSP
jgi:sugar lactone lactonase YvrE